MISIDAYRISIGNFNSTRQLDLRSIFRHLVLNLSLSSKGFSRILKPAPFLAAALYFSIILIAYGDIETNPGPVNFRKVVGFFSSRECKYFWSSSRYPMYVHVNFGNNMFSFKTSTGLAAVGFRYYTKNRQ